MQHTLQLVQDPARAARDRTGRRVRWTRLPAGEEFARQVHNGTLTLIPNPCRITMYSAPGYPNYSTADTAPRIGEWLSEGFTLFGREWFTWIAQGCLLLLLGVGPYLGGWVMFFVLAIGSGGATNSNSPAAQAAGATVGLMAFGAVLMGLLVMGLVLPYLLMGMKRTAAKQLRGEPISVRDIFSGGEGYLSTIGASILIYLATGVGYNFCLVPGYLLAGMWCMTLPLIAEKRVGAIEALQESWNTTRQHMWMYMLWEFVLQCVFGAGILLVGVGLLVTGPVTIIAQMAAYRDVIGIPGAASQSGSISTAPSGPAVNYGPAGPPVTGARCPACERPVALGAVMCPHCHAQIPSGYA